jgi:hypothetical protein
MKMYEVLALQNFYASVQDKKMPVKTAYKLSRLARKAEEEVQFYQKEFGRIVNEYALKENGQLVYSDDMTSIKIIPGKEDECNEKIIELKELEIDLAGIEFTIEELENLELTLAEMSAIFSLIKD